MRLIDADALREATQHSAWINWKDVEDAPTIGGWISVQDKLPEKQGVYLVAFKPPFPKVTIAWWATREYGWYDLEYNFNTDGISHWMPLPPMPEQEVTGDAYVQTQ